MLLAATGEANASTDKKSRSSEKTSRTREKPLESSSHLILSPSLSVVSTAAIAPGNCNVCSRGSRSRAAGPAAAAAAACCFPPPQREKWPDSVRWLVRLSCLRIGLAECVRLLVRVSLLLGGKQSWFNRAAQWWARGGEKVVYNFGPSSVVLLAWQPLLLLLRLSVCLSDWLAAAVFVVLPLLLKLAATATATAAARRRQKQQQQQCCCPQSSEPTTKPPEF